LRLFTLMISNRIGLPRLSDTMVTAAAEGYGGGMGGHIMIGPGHHVLSTASMCTTRLVGRPMTPIRRRVSPDSAFVILSSSVCAPHDWSLPRYRFTFTPMHVSGRGAMPHLASKQWQGAAHLRSCANDTVRLSWE
jgi:hypothetical protein